MWNLFEGDRNYFYGSSSGSGSVFAHHGHGTHHAPTYVADAPQLSPFVELKVEMRSERSRKVIMRKLAKLKGVATVDVDVYNQKVTVTGNVTPAEVLKKVRKTGRKADYWRGDTLHTSSLAYTPGYSSAGYSSGPVFGYSHVYTN